MPKIKTASVWLLLFFILLCQPRAIFAQDESDHLWKRVSQTRPQMLMDTLGIEESQISAIVSYGRFAQVTIRGYTSPEAKIQLTSSQANLGPKNTKANNDGFFQFENIIIPERSGEIWLQATDTGGITSPPVAIPEPPIGISKIEDIILPPTIAHSKGIFKKSSRSLAFGQATPNSKIEVYLYEVSSSQNWLEKLLLASSLTPRNAQAQEKESSSALSLTTDDKGYFSFDLPNQKNRTFRYYVGSIFLDNYSPKSNTLSFSVLSWPQIFCQQLSRIADNGLSLALKILQDLLFWIFWEVIVLTALVKKNRPQKQPIKT